MRAYHCFLSAFSNLAGRCRITLPDVLVSRFGRMLLVGVVLTLSTTAQATPIAGAGIETEDGFFSTSGSSIAYKAAGTRPYGFGRVRADLTQGKYQVELESSRDPLASVPWWRGYASGGDTFYIYDFNDLTSTRTVGIDISVAVHGKLRALAARPNANAGPVGAAPTWHHGRAFFGAYGGSWASEKANYALHFNEQKNAWMYNECHGGACTEVPAPIVNGYAEVQVNEFLNYFSGSYQLGSPLPLWMGFLGDVSTDDAVVAFWDTAAMSFTSSVPNLALRVTSEGGMNLQPSPDVSSVPEPGTVWLLLAGLAGVGKLRRNSGIRWRGY